MVVRELNKKYLSRMIPPDLVLAEKLVYKPSNLLQNLKKEDESADYGASEFTLDDYSIKFRVGKITSKKVGQFITFWKRIGRGPILPYDFNDSFDFLIVSVRTNYHFGHFVFPKAVLFERGIISGNRKEGKRAMRVYPSWDKTDNSQAKKTQVWQLHYFIDFSKGNFDCASNGKYWLNNRLSHDFNKKKFSETN